MATYRTCEIARALGVRPRQITSVADRGLLPADRGNGTGHHRTFSRDDAFRFALWSRLVDLGIGHTRASVIAGEHSGAHGVLVVTSTAARVQPRQAFNLPGAAVLVDLDRLRAEIDERLAVAA